MISQITFHNLKALQDVCLPLQPLTVLVGPNGVGKSTALLGIEMLAQLTQPSPTTRIIGPAAAIFSAAKPLSSFLSLPHADDAILKITAFNQDPPVSMLEVALTPATKHLDLLRAGSPERVVYTRSNGRELAFDSSSIYDNLKLADFLKGIDLGNPRRLHVLSAMASERSVGAKGVPDLSVEGTGLPTFLQYMMTRRDGSLERLEEDLATLVPDFRRIVVEPVEVSKTINDPIDIDGQTFNRKVQRSEPGFALFLEFAGIGAVSADHVSEGTLLALGLLAMLHGPSPAKVILVDDIDRALHPAAQQGLIKLIRRVQERRPALQIIATTHSPDLVDGFAPEEVLVMHRPPNARGTMVRGLHEHPEAARWLKMLRVGEFWSSVGESWVAG